MKKKDKFQAAPEFPRSATWLNGSVTLAGLAGKVVLVHFWDYNNIYCLDGMAYLKRWHARYEALGLRIVGVHSPEFPFARSRNAVRTAITALELHYPVLLDNKFDVWKAYGNGFWPSFHLIDAQGCVRFVEVGESAYQTVESVIQDLLREAGCEAELPPLLEPVRPRDEPGVALWPISPNIYTGYEHGGVGNSEGYDPHRVVSYDEHDGLMKPGKFYLEGKWLNHRFCVAMAKGGDGTEASIHVGYTAAEVNMVVNPSGDQGFLVDVFDNGAPLDESNAGAHVRLVGDGDARRSQVLIHDPKMYRVIKHDRVRSGVFKVTARSSGFTLFAFTFVSSPYKDSEERCPAIEALIEGVAAPSLEESVLTARERAPLIEIEPEPIEEAAEHEVPAEDRALEGHVGGEEGDAPKVAAVAKGQGKVRKPKPARGAEAKAAVAAEGDAAPDGADGAAVEAAASDAAPVAGKKPSKAKKPRKAAKAAPGAAIDSAEAGAAAGQGAQTEAARPSKAAKRKKAGKSKAAEVTAPTEAVAVDGLAVVGDSPKADEATARALEVAAKVEEAAANEPAAAPSLPDTAKVEVAATEVEVVAPSLPEVAASQAEPAPSLPEGAASPSEAAASPPEAAASPPEAAASPPEAAASQPEAAANPSETAASPSETAASPSEAAASPSEAAASPSEAAASPSEAAARPSEIAARPSEIAASLPEVAASQPVVAASPSEIAAGPSEIAAGLPEIAASLPEVAASQPEVAASQPEAPPSQPEVPASLPEPQVAANADELQPDASADEPAAALVADAGQPAAKPGKKGKARKKSGRGRDLEIPADTPRILLQLSKPRKRKTKRAKKADAGAAARMATPPGAAADKPNGKAPARPTPVKQSEPVEQPSEAPIAAAAERG